MKMHWAIWGGLAAIGACGSPRDIGAQAAAPSAGGTCTIAQTLVALPEDVRETSGLAVSRRHPGVLWTHNDSGFEPVIFALGTDGSLKARVKVNGVTLTDWEDIESAACEGGGCLYIADIGDNQGNRLHVTIWEISEPDLTATTVSARGIQARYADGPQDAEALFRLPSGDMYVLTKGRQGTIKLYRFVPVAGSSEQATLNLVREVAPHPTNELDRVTAATASPDGKWVAIRTYQNLFLYRTEDLLGSGSATTTYSLLPLKEKQGESVTLSDQGEIWVTSEAENKKDMPTVARITCALP